MTDSVTYENLRGGTQNKTRRLTEILNNWSLATNMKVYVVALSVLAVASALPMAKEEGPLERFISTLRDCVETDTMLCLKVCGLK